MAPTAVELVSLRALSSACVHLVAGAGALIRDVAGPHRLTSAAALGVVAKHDDTPQTVADRHSQRHIVSGLRRAHPTFAHVALVGEEGGEEADAAWAHAPVADLTLLDSVWSADEDVHVPAADVAVFVDPLDGTKEFTRGRYAFVTVLVGITVRGEPAIGVIGEPYADDGAGRILCGGSVRGAFELRPANGSPRPLAPPADDDAGRTAAVVSLSRSGGAVHEALAQLEAKGLVTARIPAGGAGYKAACVVDGRAALWLFPRAGTSRWDTCAAQALIEAVGGALVDRTGARIRYDAASTQHGNALGVVACRDRSVMPAVVAVTASLRE